MPRKTGASSRGAGKICRVRGAVCRFCARNDNVALCFYWILYGYRRGPALAQTACHLASRALWLGGLMGFAANTIMDVVAPPPPARASNANAQDDNAPSFRDHVDAADEQAQRNDTARARSDSSSRSDISQPSQQSDTQTKPSDTQESAKQDEHAQQAPAHAPALLQLIAAAAPNVLGAKVEQGGAQQSAAPAIDQPAAQADATQTAAVVVAAPPTSTSPKTDASTRPAHGKAKGATGKTVASNAAEATPAQQTQVQPAQDTPVQSAAPAIVAPVASQGDDKNKVSAKADGIEAVQDTPTRTAAPKQHAPSAPAAVAPSVTPAPQKSDEPQAKTRDAGKALAPVDAVKQAAQDFAPTAAKAQSQPATPSLNAAHAPIAEPVQQAVSDTSAQRGAPVAAQVGGEIVRRFNGSDTSFQLRLDPPELGRVDVRLDVSRDHRVTAVISADSPQALSDLARGARDLQQALQSAGLDVADDGLRFDLSSNGQGNSFAQAHAHAQQDQSNFRATNTAQNQTSTTPEVTASRPLSIDSWRGSRVDLVA